MNVQTLKILVMYLQNNEMKLFDIKVATLIIYYDSEL